MHYEEEKILKAFKLYTLLAREGKAEKEAARSYLSDDVLRGLLDTFAHEVDCVIIATSEQLYLVPEAKLSPFHMTNESIKKKYLRAQATNQDLYLLYFASLIFFGSFYDSYQSKEATRDFIKRDEWVRLVDERILHLTSHDEETLKASQEEFSYNWLKIIDKWMDMDDIKESAKRQSGNTISRLSFIDSCKKFLEDQELLKEIGNFELVLTEKAKTIVERYFMEADYNKDIFAFMYALKKEDPHANHQ